MRERGPRAHCASANRAGRDHRRQAPRTAKFDYETTSPTNLGFDLNTTGDNVTIVTSWWSSQWLQILDSTGTLFVP